MTTESPYVIEVEHLTVSYHARAALLDVSVRIERDQLVGVIGPNGAGKSTFIKAILGFIKPDIGTVLINGGDAQKATGQVAYVPQRGAVDWDFPITVQEVAMMGRYQQIPWYTSPRPTDYQAAREALEMVRMEKFGERQIGELSGGQQQRVALARAVANSPPLILVDEPTGNLDAVTTEGVMTLLNACKNSGATVVIATHDESIFRDTTHRVMELRSGRLHLVREGAAL